MISPGIFFKNFNIKKRDSNIKKKFQNFIDENDQVLQSLGKNYKDKFEKKNLKNYKNYNDVRIIGMGGSSLGSKSIYNFLKHKIKKNFIFINDLSSKAKIDNKKKHLNLVVSKSGGTIETIVNSNIHIKKKTKISLLLKIKKIIYIFLVKN